MHEPHTFARASLTDWRNFLKSNPDIEAIDALVAQGAFDRMLP